jgi:hypothetical protein
VGVSSVWHTTSAATAEMHGHPDLTIVKCHRSPPKCTARSFPHKLEYKEMVVHELEQRPLVISKVFDIFAAGDELKLQKHTVRTNGTDLCFM